MSPTCVGVGDGLLPRQLDSDASMVVITRSEDPAVHNTGAAVPDSGPVNVYDINKMIDFYENSDFLGNFSYNMIVKPKLICKSKCKRKFEHNLSDRVLSVLGDPTDLKFSGVFNGNVKHEIKCKCSKNLVKEVALILPKIQSDLVE